MIPRTLSLSVIVHSPNLRGSSECPVEPHSHFIIEDSHVITSLCDCDRCPSEALGHFHTQREKRALAHGNQDVLFLPSEAGTQSR